MILDTCVFIDAQRKASTLERLKPDYKGFFVTTIISVGELAEGIPDPTPERLAQATLGLPIIGIDGSVAAEYGRISRRLRLSGQRIGPNDTWIAAIAVASKMPLLTNNRNEFGRVPGLVVVTY